MFMLNLGYKWTWATNLDEIRNVVYLACGNDYQRMTRSAMGEFHRVLFDPQLYLAGLDAETCSKVCARLASFPWFSLEGAPEFVSGEMRRTEWTTQMREFVQANWTGALPADEADRFNACFDCIELQQSIGCTHIILPCPIIDERENEAAMAAEWLEQGIEAKDELEVGQPVLATVAIHEMTINDAAFRENGFLDTVADQIVSRDGIDGVYFLIVQNTNGHPFESSSNVWRAYLHLSDAFGQHLDHVVVNFADLFGLVCLSGSATAVIGGNSHALRRMAFDNYLDESFGFALPHFYSNCSISESLTESDLDIVVNRRILRRVRDVTRFSRPLMRELSNGGSASNLPAWAESRNNTAESTSHFLARFVAEANRLAAEDVDERQELVQEWLEEADVNQNVITRRFSPANYRGKMAPSEDWLRVFEEILRN